MRTHCSASHSCGWQQRHSLWQQYRYVLGPLLAAWLAASSLLLASPAFASGLDGLDPNGACSVHSPGNDGGITASQTISYFTFFPVAARAFSCTPVGGTFGTVAPYLVRTSPPAADNPELNLALRGYVSTNAYKGLVDYGGSSDSRAPQLYSLFTNYRTATFRNVYQVYEWDSTCGCPSYPITYWDVTRAGLATTPGEVILTPASGYDIGLMTSGYEVMVLYASETQLTLKYTREDDISVGYALYLEDLCVDPYLLSLYQYWNSMGRTRLPALNQGQPLGRARGNEIGVVIRDSGMFMDPRSRKDWWQGR